MDTWSIYFAGILSFFSPCILPIIPVYFSILVQDKDTTAKTILPHGLLFCLGFCIIFSLLGLGAGQISSLMVDHRAFLSLIAGLIVLIISLKMLDVINIPVLDRSYSFNINKIKTRFTFLNSFVFGVLFAVTWSPCIGPVMGGILTYISARTLSPFSGAIQLFLFGLGISTPLIISTIFFGKLSMFARNNKYFIIILQKALGILLVIFAINLFGAVITMAERPKIITGSDKIVTPDQLPLFISMIQTDCESCEEMKPTIKKLIDSCNGKNIEFRTIDTENPEHSYIVSRLGMMGTPTYILIDKAGKEVQRFIGYNKLKDLDEAIFKLTGKRCLNN